MSTVVPFRQADLGRAGPEGQGARAGQVISAVQANVSYQFLTLRDHVGASQAIELGQGKFAKVFKGMQRSAGRAVRPVAIKVLHDFASLPDERLFRQEIELLKDMSVEGGVNVVRTLDILELRPMVMCSCGNVYHPACPNGCEALLLRLDAPPYPALFCPRCDYVLSARSINERFGELLTPPARRCCQDDRSGLWRRILNFVDREAIVMELLEENLVDFLGRRRLELQDIGDRLGLSWQDVRGQAPPAASFRRRVWSFLGGMWRQDRKEVRFHKAVLLEKVRLMVELAQAVVWLHRDKSIVHKDLAPDNVMVSFTGTGGGASEAAPEFAEALDAMIGTPRFHLRVIDFGLSDKDQLTRSWYEEEANAGTLKLSFFSPEACVRRIPVSQPLRFYADHFRIPKELATHLMATDILADNRDGEHNHDLEIVGVEHDAALNDRVAYFRGALSGNAGQKFDLVRRLGEPHDLYAVGALLYFILTEQLDEVSSLQKFVGLLEDDRAPLTEERVARHPNYLKRREALTVRFWQDELMMLILRAMVRGCRGSLKQSRIDRGPVAAQTLLREIKEIHNGIQEEILSAPRVARRDRVIAVLVVMLLLVLGLVLFIAARHSRGLSVGDATNQAGGATAAIAAGETALTPASPRGRKPFVVISGGGRAPSPPASGSPT